MPQVAPGIEAEKDSRAPVQRAAPSRTEGAIGICDLRVDPLTRAATHKGGPLMLSPMEFELLVFLARNPGRAFSREQLLRNVWGLDPVGHRHVVAVNIGWLRAKLGDPGRLIQSVVGGGYRLVAPHRARP